MFQSPAATTAPPILRECGRRRRRRQHQQDDPGPEPRFVPARLQRPQGGALVPLPPLPLHPGDGKAVRAREGGARPQGRRHGRRAVHVARREGGGGGGVRRQAESSPPGTTGGVLPSARLDCRQSHHHILLPITLPSVRRRRRGVRGGGNNLSPSPSDDKRDGLPPSPLLPFQSSPWGTV